MLFIDVTSTTYLLRNKTGLFFRIYPNFHPVEIRILNGSKHLYVLSR